VLFIRGSGILICGDSVEEAFHLALNVMSAIEIQVWCWLHWSCTDSRDSAEWKMCYRPIIVSSSESDTLNCVRILCRWFRFRRHQAPEGLFLWESIFYFYLTFRFELFLKFWDRLTVLQLLSTTLSQNFTKCCRFCLLWRDILFCRRVHFLSSLNLCISPHLFAPGMEMSIWWTKSHLVADCGKRVCSAAFWLPCGLA